MKQFVGRHSLIIALILVSLILITSCAGQQSETQQDLDERVQQFLNEHRGQWRDANVPKVIITPHSDVG